MKYRLFQKVALLFLIQVVFAQNASAGKLPVAASIFPLGSLVQEIGGEEVEVFTLLAKNVSPHIYEPAPKDVIHLRESRAFFLIGLGLEPWAEKLVQGKEENELKVIKTGAFLSHMNEHQEEEGHHHHGGINPHIWLSPEHSRKIAEVVFQELVLLKPESINVFTKNFREFLLKMEEIQQQISQLKEHLSRADVRIITFHDSFSYLFEALELKNVQAIEPFPGKKPSLKRLKELVDFMQGGDVKAIFTEPQFSGRMTEVIVTETGARKGLLDPIGCSSCEGRDGYFNLLRYNLGQIESVCR